MKWCMYVCSCMCVLSAANEIYIFKFSISGICCHKGNMQEMLSSSDLWCLSYNVMRFQGCSLYFVYISVSYSRVYVYAHTLTCQNEFTLNLPVCMCKNLWCHLTWCSVTLKKHFFVYKHFHDRVVCMCSCAIQSSRHHRPLSV